MKAAFDWNSAGAWLFVWLALLGVGVGSTVAVTWWRSRARSPVDEVNDALARRRRLARERERHP